MNQTNNIFILLIFPLFAFAQYNIDETMLNADINESQNINIFTIDSDITISGSFLCKFNSYSITIKSDYPEYSIRVIPSLLDSNSKISVQDDDETKNLTKINISPNPTKNNLTISTEQIIKIMEIYNSYGVKQKVVNKGKTLDLRTYKKGIYLLKIQLENSQIITKTIIKQ